MGDEEPDIQGGANRGTPDRLGGLHPAVVRPGPTAPVPPSRDPDWYERLRGTMDLDAIMGAARECRRARNHHEDPAWPSIHARLLIAQAMLLDAKNQDPSSRTVAEYLKQVNALLGAR